jgi:hypothetical protein
MSDDETAPPDGKVGPKKKKKVPRPKAGLPPEGDLWSSPVCFEARSLSQLLRDSLDALGYKYTRRQTDKLYQKVMVLVPYPKSTYVFRFELKGPVKVWIDLYDTIPTHSGIIPYMDIQGLTDDKKAALKELFDDLIGRLPRPPWQFTIGQRLQHGLVIPEWRKAKKAWRSLGYKI